MNVTTSPGITACRVAAAAFAFFLAGCATAPAPSSTVVAELAGTGKVRVALINVGNYISQPRSTEPIGVGVDIGKALAARVGAPFEPVVYDSVAALLADARAGKWDVALLASDPSRNADFEFSRPYALTQNTYLVPVGSSLMTISDIDRNGVAVAVHARSAQHNYLRANLKAADLRAIEGGTDQESKELAAGRAHAFAANRTALEEMAARMPGYRLLPGSFSDVRYALGVPKGRKASAAYVDEFVRDMVASGAIADSIARAQLKGVTPAN